MGAIRFILFGLVSIICFTIMQRVVIAGAAVSIPLMLTGCGDSAPLVQCDSTTMSAWSLIDGDVHSDVTVSGSFHGDTAGSSCCTHFFSAAAAFGNSQPTLAPDANAWASSLPDECKDATGIGVCLGFGGFAGCGSNTGSCRLDNAGGYKVDRL